MKNSKRRKRNTAREVYPAKLSFRNEEEMFVLKQKLRALFYTRPASQKTLIGFLQAEKK